MNEYILYNDYVEIILYDKKGNEKARTLIDIEDLEKCSYLKWGYSSGYAKNSKEKIYLHRYVLNIEKENVDIDHINHNTLDNRKSNLRICSHKNNIRNSKKSKNNTTGIIGVYWAKNQNKYSAAIVVNKKQIHLGYFNTKEEAAKARKEAEEKYFKEFRYKQ